MCLIYTLRIVSLFFTTSLVWWLRTNKQDRNRLTDMESKLPKGKGGRDELGIGISRHTPVYIK